MPLNENSNLSLKDVILIIGFVAQIAVTYGVITTKLNYYEENSRKLERTIEKLDNKLEAVVLEIYKSRRATN